MKLAYSRLKFDNRCLPEIIDKYKHSKSIVIADKHSFQKLDKPVIVIKNNFSAQIPGLCELAPKRIIAVGGCTALDVGRACSSETNAEFIAIPTILSTSCIGASKSVLRDERGKFYTLPTIAPDEIVISLSVLLDNPPSVIWKWSASGLGDFFGNFSAALDCAVNNCHAQSRQEILDSLPLFQEVLSWVLYSFEKFDAESTKKLALYLYEASLLTRKADHKVGGEHRLYYAISEQPKCSSKDPTHGEVVAIGTLLTMAAYQFLTDKWKICADLSKAYRKLRLPLSCADLNHINFGIERLKEGILTVAKADYRCSIGRFVCIGSGFESSANKLIEMAFSK